MGNTRRLRPQPAIPADIRPKWLDVIRRLQSVARSKGHSRLKITIWCNANGDPVMWTEPEVKHLEPAKSAGEALGEISKFPSSKAVVDAFLSEED